MACTTIVQGSSIDCLNSIGGIEEIYITEFTNVPQGNITASSGVISAMSCSSGKKFFTFQLKKQTAESTESIVSNVENGTLYFEQKITFTLPKQSASLRYTLKTLAENRCMVITKDRNGIIKLYGQTTGCDISESSFSTGKTFGDFNGATISLTGMEPELASTLSSAILATVTV
jgi:hypothetical protein